MSSAPQIRRLTPDYAEVYVALRRRAVIEEPFAFLGAPGDDPASDAAVMRERLASAEQAVFGAVLPGSELAGFAGIYREMRVKTRHRCTVWGVYVAPAWRGRGLGSRLVGACVEDARTRPGVGVVELCVSTRTHAARRVYESLGFVAWGTQPDVMRVDGASSDEVHMRLVLNAGS